jgi:hypothetical protein
VKILEFFLELVAQRGDSVGPLVRTLDKNQKSNSNVYLQSFFSVKTVLEKPDHAKGWQWIYPMDI